MPDTVPSALAALARGQAVVVLDDEGRENEADLVIAAEFADPARVAFFLEHTSGFLCVALSGSRAAALSLPPMAQDNTESHGTAFLVSVDYKPATTTGISAYDRSATIKALADPRVTAAQFARPGHVLPLQARPGGVLERPGHTEASVDLCRMAGLAPAALICELVRPDRLDMMRGAEAVEFAHRYGLCVITVAEIARHRLETEPVVVKTGEAELPTPYGPFRASAYRVTGAENIEHLALTRGELADGLPTLVRVHSECLTGDLIRSLRCDCGAQFEQALSRIGDHGRGALIYLRGQEGRGIGLGNKLRAYHLQERLGLDTVEANVELGFPVDGRSYAPAAAILRDLGVEDVRLMTNNPDKCASLEQLGLAVQRVPLEISPTPHNVRYLQTKRDTLGHQLTLEEAPPDNVVRLFAMPF
jgi:3,4-dihydroxy 2-butanone 4-phosphate synthase / GTP cyclohydrolase II